MSAGRHERLEQLLQGGVELRSLDRERFRQVAELLQDPALALRAGDALQRMSRAAARLGLRPALP